jgi:TQXA domain-containing protein/LPXTG-motif cell wall-anchored protein
MRRFVPTCLGFAGAAAMLLAAAAPAAADDAVTGRVDHDGNVIGYQVNVGDDWLATIPTNLLGFKLADGTDLGMYCVELHTDIDDQHDMVERPWNDYPDANSPFNTNRAKINWVLHHGYPGKSLADVAAQLAPVQPHDGIDVLEAIAATQAAVWHYSDGVDLNRDDPLSGDASNQDDAADALALYDYLTGPANTGIDEAPIPALSVAPADKEGTAGTRIGPFTVGTNATVEQLTADLPDGVRVTDEDGNDIAAGAITDGTELYLDVPAGTVDGDGTFELTASAAVDTGRLFVGENYAKHPTQSLIVAAAVKTKLTASAGASWTTAPPTTTTTTTTTPPTTTVPPTTTTTAAPTPQGGLAQTGASIFWPVLIGVVLVAGGVGALVFLRRRRA